jgi:hypothetical protein
MHPKLYIEDEEHLADAAIRHQLQTPSLFSSLTVSPLPQPLRCANYGFPHSPLTAVDRGPRSFAAQLSRFLALFLSLVSAPTQ